MGPTDRVVVLIDMDCFYCQVEEKLDPELEGKPIAVVQYNTWRGGGIIAVNYPARDEGVTRHMRGNEAKQKCPSIRLVQVPEVRGKADLTKYRDAGKRVADVLGTFTPLLERASVDEAYLDITSQVEEKIKTNLNDLVIDNLKNTYVVGCDLKDFIHNAITNGDFSGDHLKLAVGGLIAEEIRHQVFEQTGYKCSAGIAHNKILAKLVCSLHKPNKQTILPQDAVNKFFETMKICKIKSLGGKFGQSLSDHFQITYMGQLATISEKYLASKYEDKTAKWLYNIARGIDTEPVTTKLISKSIATSKNFAGKTALTTSENVEHWLMKLAEETSERLVKDLKENNRKAKQVIISFSQKIDKKNVSSTRTQSLGSYEAKKIAQTAFEVIKKNCLRSDGSYHLTHLGLNACNFEDVKKVREITSFFQIGQPKSICSKQKLDITTLNSRNSTDDEVAEENVYYQQTQELEENIEDLIFYDDSFRIKLGDNTLEISNDNSNEVESCNVNFNKPSPSRSFFTKYFDKAPKNDGPVVQEVVSIEHEEDSEETAFEGTFLEETSEFCSQCNQNIAASEFSSHQDYHFALQLSKSENIPNIQTVVVDKKRGRGKNMKRKIDKNNTLAVYFKKNDEESLCETETCHECSRKIPVQEMSSHKDYHIAKRIHLEINAVTPLQISKKCESKTNMKKTNKNQSSSQSVISFFRPG